ncbi:hypothetical protein ScalyP_jg3387 [Parmales sp. scaly parma]|nr:hypothetical protein ScalyP_jg3387 [Parmales sp. scaly parma]
MELVLLAGQSNLSGRCRIAPLSGSKSFASIYRSKTKSFDNYLQPQRPSHYDSEVSHKQARTGFGIVEVLCDLCQVASQRPVGFIPSAIGGSSIEQWIGSSVGSAVDIEGSALDVPPPPPPPSSPSSFFTKSISHATLALSIAPPTSSVTTLIWYQGESDCNESSLPTYKTMLVRILQSYINSLRALTKIIVVGITTTAPNLFPHVCEIRKMQVDACETVAAFAETAETHCKIVFVDAKGVPMYSDGLHVNEAGARVLGERIFYAMSNSTSPQVSNYPTISSSRTSVLEHISSQPPLTTPQSNGFPSTTLFSKPRRFVNFVYGEITMESVYDICSAAKLKSGDTVVDLGCGTGMVLTASGVWGRVNRVNLGRLVGLDLMRKYLDEGEIAMKFFAKQAAKEGGHWPESELLEVDFLEEWGGWVGGDLIVCCSTCYDAIQMEAISRICYDNLKIGAIVVTLDKELPKIDGGEGDSGEQFVVICKLQVAGSWGKAVGIVHEKCCAEDIESRILQSSSTNQTPNIQERENACTINTT